MIVALDTRPLHNQSATRGIGVYTSSLLSHLKKIPNLQITELTQGRIPEGIDLIHYPWFDLYFRTLPMPQTIPTILTIHDVTPLILKDLYPSGIKGWLNFQFQKRALKKIDAIVCDSECTTNDVIQNLPVRPEIVSTVYLAPQSGLITHPTTELKQAVITKYHLYDPYVLYVGDVNRNKNLITLVQSCISLGINLVIVGKQAVKTDYDHHHIENLDLVTLQHQFGKHPGVKRLGFVPTEELSAIFNLASVYCQPSIYEGFGVTVVEAMTCGCPVIATKRGSLPEIGGSAAIYTEPEESKITKAIKFVLELSEAQRNRLIQEGRHQAKKFTWEQATRETYEIYKRCLNHH